MKRSRIKRSLRSLKRLTAMTRGKRLSPVSRKRRAENRVRAKIPMLDYCEVWEANIHPGIGWYIDPDFPKCYGKRTRHEVLTRARGGSITDPKNIKTCCAAHNSWLSQSPEGLKWGHARGYLLHSWDEDLG